MSNIVYVVIGVLAALFVVLVVGFYSAPEKTTGISIAFSRGGLSIHEKSTD